jgi:sugar phosphate isomerase/epimerase
VSGFSNSLWIFAWRQNSTNQGKLVNAMSRREFIQSTAVRCGVAGVLASSLTKLGANPLNLPIGSQVWPMRSMLKDFPAFAKMIAGIGVTRLELCSPIGYGAEFSSLANAKEVGQILADHGLKSESSHFTMDELRHKQEKSIAWAKEIGITQMITASLGDGHGGSHPTLDQVSKRTYDLLYDLLDPKLVKFQFQMSTITAGLVAADYFTRYPGRFCSMHLQDVDLKREARQQQVALGQGSIDWMKTFSAAKTGGVKNYFVEQNWELTQPSVAYLKSLNV